MVLNQAGPDPAVPGEMTEIPLSVFGGDPLDTSGETIYYFKAFAYNLGEALDHNDADSISAHQFAPGVMGGARVGGAVCGPVTYNFDAGLNDFAIVSLPVTLDIIDPANNIITISNVNTAADFVNAINSVYPGAATTIGWLADGRIVGYYVSDGAFTATEGADIAADGSQALAISPYQISVTEGMTITVR
jgi:hypothetical protein